ncbi:MAG: biopolymer transporter ExbD [Pseudomonadota bacterium]
MRKKHRSRKLSMTSLIDVIFLLLLFFMLSSTFSRFAEVELSAATGGGSAKSDTPVTFVQLGQESLSFNGKDLALETLPTELKEVSPEAESVPVIISLRDEVSAQRLTDLLVVLRGVDRLKISVLGS